MLEIRGCLHRSLHDGVCLSCGQRVLPGAAASQLIRVKEKLTLSPTRDGVVDRKYNAGWRR